MDDKTDGSQKAESSGKSARAAASLRANLGRRKAQKRARDAEASPDKETCGHLLDPDKG